jgi:hypothetical protein
MSTSTLVHQRIRNRLMEYIEWVCESRVRRPALGLNEMLNQWEDFISRPIDSAGFPARVYSMAEIDALGRIDVAWERLCSATPTNIADETAAISTPQWVDFVVSAHRAKDVFALRGQLSEDIEVVQS